MRTGANHYANRARDVAAEANADLIQGRIFLATFDNRTTLTCRHFGQLQKFMRLMTLLHLSRHYILIVALFCR